MDFLSSYRREWFGDIRADILSGLVVALALIPEAIAFSIIAGVDPKVVLYASFSIAVLIAFVGRRPGMISALTVATAVLMVTLVRDHGAIPACSHRACRGFANWHRPAQARLPDALCFQIGDNWFRQCARYPDLHGATARARRMS